jgi:hypothetical protein
MDSSDISATGPVRMHNTIQMNFMQYIYYLCLFVFFVCFFCVLFICILKTDGTEDNLGYLARLRLFV